MVNNWCGKNSDFFCTVWFGLRKYCSCILYLLFKLLHDQTVCISTCSRTRIDIVAEYRVIDLLKATPNWCIHSIVFPCTTMEFIDMKRERHQIFICPFAELNWFDVTLFPPDAQLDLQNRKPLRTRRGTHKRLRVSCCHRHVIWFVCFS